MATYSSVLAWKIPWTEEPGGLQSRGSKRVGNNLVTEHTHTNYDMFESKYLSFKLYLCEKFLR